VNRTCGAVCVDCCRIVCRSSWQRHVRVCISSRLSISCWLTVYMKSWETRHHSWVRQQRVWSTWWRQFHSRQTEQMSCRGDWITPTHSSRPRFTTSQRYQPQVMMTFWQQAASHIMPLLGTEWPRLLRTPQQRLAVLFSQTDNPQNCLFLWGNLHPIKYMVPWAHMSQSANGILIGSAVILAQYIGPANTQTDHAICDICHNRPAWWYKCLWCCHGDLVVFDRNPQDSREPGKVSHRVCLCVWLSSFLCLWVLTSAVLTAAGVVLTALVVSTKLLYVEPG